jgi:DNA-directed RNA polymerase subunit RPC12/RpoP
MQCRCSECGEIFDNPHRVTMEDSDVGAAAFRKYVEYACPHCGSDEWDEVGECELCGSMKSETFMSGRAHFCLECLDELRDRALELLRAGLCEDEYRAFVDFYDMNARIN